MYDFECEHCGGQVIERTVQQEALRHKGSFVVLEQVPVGVCQRCGARYYDASVLRRVAEVAKPRECARTLCVPVDRYASREPVPQSGS